MIFPFPELSMIKTWWKAPIVLIYKYMQHKVSESWSFKNSTWQVSCNSWLNCQPLTVAALTALGTDMKIQGMYLLPEKDLIL